MDLCPIVKEFRICGREVFGVLWVCLFGLSLVGPILYLEDSTDLGTF